MAVKISFADLTHTGQKVHANVFPLGISMVAAYSLEKFGGLHAALTAAYGDS